MVEASIKPIVVLREVALPDTNQTVNPKGEFLQATPPRFTSGIVQTTTTAPTAPHGMPTQMEMASVMPATANLLARSLPAMSQTAVTTVTT